MLKTICILALGLSVACLANAASTVMIGKPRSAIEPDQVRVYLKAPANSEELAIVNADAGGAFTTDQNRMDRVLKKLKGEAAKIGANGLVLGETTTESNNGWGMISKGRALALYVKPD